MDHFALYADSASQSDGPAREIARLNAEVGRLRTLCRSQATTLERLTGVLRRMRSGALALREQNGELADQVDRVRSINAQQANGRSRSSAPDEPA